ncbi:Solute carrier organic anion transporter family member 2B1 [Camelus dromedarius]|uniref:Solute carrier organic anion transporter family member 2B1 n=1 Tax=Camelus dromedarius TaxID=9838 RepID=A0A5N4DMQ3_CAMDR|nr:Solute carrier organic anion transporter family member 2B1 [Camelus dromedarius]
MSGTQSLTLGFTGPQGHRSNLAPPPPAWMPSPVIHGSAIDTTCVYWAQSCGRRAVCRYYDHNLLRNRFLGLQFFFKTGSLACFTLILAILRQQNKEEGTKETIPSPGLQQQLLDSGPKKEPEESRV